MPIPIAQIPNAPQVGGPVLTPTAAGPQGQRAQNVNLLSAAGQVNAPKLQQGAFDGAAEGMAIAGRSIASLGAVGERVSSVLTDIQDRKNRFQDEVSLATYNRRIGEEFAAYQGTLQEKSESEWLPGWQAKFSEIAPKIAEELKFSPAGQQQLAIENQNFMRSANVSLMTSASRAAIERGTGELLAQADRYNEEGNDEEAAATLGKLVDLGAIRKDQAESKMRSWQETRNNNGLTQLMQMEPKLFLEDIQAEIKGESTPISDNFPQGPERAIQLKKWEGIAIQNMRQFQAETTDALDDGILRGEIISEEQIRQQAEAAGLSERDTQSFVQSLSVQEANTPEGQAKYLTKFDELWTKSVNYDPLSDPDGANRMAILRDIRENVIPGEKQPLLDNLRQATKDGMTPERERAANMENAIDRLASTGLLIKPPKNKDDRKAMQEYEIALAERKTVLKNSVRDYVKTNPGQDPAKDTDWMRGKVGPDAAKQVSLGYADSSESGSLTDWIPRIYGGGLGMPVMIGYPKERDKVSPQQIEEKLNKAGNSPLGDLDESLIDSVKSWESFNPAAYGDYKQTSIGYGTRAKPGEKSITAEEADKRLREELSMHARNVDGALKSSSLRLTPAQRAALISFDFNTGKGAHLIQTSDSPEEIASRMALYTKVTENGKKVHSKGLANRRAKELALFNS